MPAKESGTASAERERRPWRRSRSSPAAPLSGDLLQLLPSQDLSSQRHLPIHRHHPVQRQLSPDLEPGAPHLSPNREPGPVPLSAPPGRKLDPEPPGERPWHPRRAGSALPRPAPSTTSRRAPGGSDRRRRPEAPARSRIIASLDGDSGAVEARESPFRAHSGAAPLRARTRWMTPTGQWRPGAGRQDLAVPELPGRRRAGPECCAGPEAHRDSGTQGERTVRLCPRDGTRASSLECGSATVLGRVTASPPLSCSLSPISWVVQERRQLP